MVLGIVVVVFKSTIIKVVFSCLASCLLFPTMSKASQSFLGHLFIDETKFIWCAQGKNSNILVCAMQQNTGGFKNL